MTTKITVVVAPGGSVSISPHPSGLAQLGPLHLRDGETLQVTREKAEQLYQRGDILHPDTGRPKPTPTPVSGPTVTYGAGRAIPVSDPGALVAAAERATRESLEEADRQHEERRRAGIRRNGMEPRNMVSTRHPTGSVDPLGPICGLSPEEGGWA